MLRSLSCRLCVDYSRVKKLRALGWCHRSLQELPQGSRPAGRSRGAVFRVICPSFVFIKVKKTPAVRSKKFETHLCKLRVMLRSNLYRCTTSCALWTLTATATSAGRNSSTPSSSRVSRLSHLICRIVLTANTRSSFLRVELRTPP